MNKKQDNNEVKYINKKNQEKIDKFLENFVKEKEDKNSPLIQKKSNIKI